MYQNLTEKRYYFDTGVGVLMYGQASVLECFEFINESTKNKYYLYEFLNDFCNKHFEPRDEEVKFLGVKIYTKREKFQFNRIDPMKLWEQLKTTYFEGFFGETNGDKSQKAPIGSVIHILGKETGQDPYELLGRWKYPQFSEWLEGYGWNMREQTEEGQKINDIWRAKHVDKDFRRKKEEQIKESIKGIDVTKFDISKLKRNG